MQELCDKALQSWEIKRIAISHRTGEVCVGQPSVIIAVSSAHRKAALEVTTFSFSFIRAPSMSIAAAISGWALAAC